MFANRQLWYGLSSHMALTAVLILSSKFIYADGAIREMVLWKLPRPTPERPHGFKYRLYYGTNDGRSIVRYDNETGKGYHTALSAVARKVTTFAVLKPWSLISFGTSIDRAEAKPHEEAALDLDQGSR